MNKFTQTNRVQNKCEHPGAYVEDTTQTTLVRDYLKHHYDVIRNTMPL